MRNISEASQNIESGGVTMDYESSNRDLNDTDVEIDDDREEG